MSPAVKRNRYSEKLLTQLMKQTAWLVFNFFAVMLLILLMTCPKENRLNHELVWARGFWLVWVMLKNIYENRIFAAWLHLLKITL